MKKPSQRRWHRIAITVLMWVSAAASFGWPAVWAVTYATLASVVVGAFIALAMLPIYGPANDKAMATSFIGYAAPALVGGFTYLFAPDAFALQLGLGVFAAQWLKDLIDKAVYGCFIWDEPA